MTHPDRELWMAYLYKDGIAQSEKVNLERHLKECPACRAQLEAWKRVGSALDALPDPVPMSRSTAPRFQPAWLAAAAALVGLGLVAGRVLLPASPNLEQVRAQLLPELRAQVRTEFAQALQDTRGDGALLSREEANRWLATYAATQEQQRRDDLLNLYGAISQVDQQRASDYSSLRKDMETVAVYADTGLRLTREKLVQLASHDRLDVPSP